MHTASGRATLDILFELPNKGYGHVVNLTGHYSDDAARSVPHAMEDKDYEEYERTLLEVSGDAR